MVKIRQLLCWHYKSTVFDRYYNEDRTIWVMKCKKCGKEIVI